MVESGATRKIPTNRSFDMSGSSNTQTLDSVEPSSSQNYAFLIHTAESLPAHLPPSVDNKSLARQKRRRTSPEDQAVLEAEYQRNPKPDKAARMAIVERVALGEKEVQIWFQNRRQSSRRKSRPLMPHEIAAYQSPYVRPPGASPSASQDASQDAIEELDKDDEEEDEDANEQEGPVSTEEIRVEGQEASQNAIPTVSQNASTSFTEVPSSQPLPSSQDSASGRMGYLANRRNGGSFRASQEDSTNVMEPNSQPEIQETTQKGLKRSSSLRMTWKMDGSAYLATNSASPSPPQKFAVPPTEAPDSIPFSLQRTQSTISLQDTSEIGPESFSLSQGSTSSLRRKPSGRSRDSRAWAFFADKEARSELEERAEEEHSGSAADAIKHLRRSTSTRSLARSISERGLLQPTSSNKRANPAPSSSFDSPHPQPSSAKRLKISNNDEGTFRQPLLPRSASGTNLQRSHHNTSNSLSKLSKTKTPKLKQSAVFEIPSATDSDKENWSPERAFAFEQSMQTSPAVPGTVSASARRKISLAHQTPRQRGMAFKTPSRIRSIARDDEEEEDDDDDDDDEEIAAFMGMGQRRREEEKDRVEDVERKSDSVSEPEDLDCVQGLLSLSQGAWR